ncbi:hypothetical protein FVE85_1854 [Porphyridium purpureum]|uniref:Uncharacterized protein n=1 Tax=Porphyridium purpureum TaxID=35688 RepID=A0A5J4YVZ8_PORPP|nr:hypothetical protein FVE85_1854 [Porphyridium purpureum]|eukprot:POR5471..scf209_3
MASRVMMLGRATRAKYAALAALVLVAVVVLESVDAQQAREPLPNFAVFRQLTNGRGGVSNLEQTMANAFYQEAVAYVQPTTGLPYAWGLYAGFLNSQFNSFPADTIVGMQMGCGDSESTPDYTTAAGQYVVYMEKGTQAIKVLANVGESPFFPSDTSSVTQDSAFRLGAGFDHACALTYDSTLVDQSTLLLLETTTNTAFRSSIMLECWGNEYGEVVSGSITNFVMGTPSTSSDPYVEVGCGFRFTCVLTLAGRIYCGGTMFLRDWRMDGSGTTFYQEDASTTVPGTPSTWGSLAVGPANWCGLSSSGSLSCYGPGLLAGVSSGVTFKQGLYTLGAGDYVVCGLRNSNDQVTCVVDPNEVNDNPGPIIGGLAGITATQITTGHNYACVTDVNFEVSCGVIDNSVFNAFGAVPFDPSAFNTFPCEQDTASIPCDGTEVIGTSGSNFLCQDTVCGIRYVFAAGGASTCFTRQVMQPIRFEEFTGGPPASGDCGLEVKYAARVVV